MRALTAPTQVWNGANLHGKSGCFFQQAVKSRAIQVHVSSGVKHE
jgi:hypothetical protein